MVKILTDGGMITFQDTITGATKCIGQNQLWISFKADTVNFLQVDIPTDGYDGTPFWSVRAANLTINGESYTIEELKSGEGLSDLFTGASFGYLIVDALPDAGEPNIIYLVYDDETGTYIEYLWLSQEETWEELGSVGDVDLTNYYTKSQTDTLLNAKADASSLATVATSGSYNDLSNKPTIPDAQVQANWGESDTESKAYIQNKPTIPVVDQTLIENSTNAAQSGATYTALQGKQATLISGTTIKTINNESLLGSGNINISGGSAQVQSDWTETNTESMAYIQHKPTIPAAQVNSDWNASSGVAQILNKPSLATVATTGAYSDLSGTPAIPTVPTNVSAFTNDAGYLTQHQSLADVFGIVDYDSSTKHINFYGKDDTSKTTVLGYVDATNFVVDGMVSNVEVKSVTISGTPTTCLVITFNSDAGKQDINIPISQIFDASNYYTKSEVDTALSGKANSSALATVATSGSYNDLSNKPTIPAAQVNSDWNASSGVAQILNKPDLSNYVTSSQVEETINYQMAYGWEASYDIDPNDIGVTINATGPAVYTDQEDATHILIPTAMTVNQYDAYAPSSAAVYNALQGKQDTLVSGTNIKTINNESILGSGNITISGGSAQVQSDWNQSDSTAVDYIKNKPTIPVVDQSLNTQSNNAISNSAVATAIGDIATALAIINGTNSNS